MEKVIEFLRKVGRLKTTKRKGWVLKGIEDAESVAEHSFRTAMLALVLSEKEGVDADKCVKMALIHDLAEAIAGDITPLDNLTKKQKSEIEAKAMRQILEGTDTGIMELWEEYDECKTPEARFVHDMDKIEMLLQAFEYEKSGKYELREFWEHVQKNIRGRTAKEIFRGLEKKK